MAKFHVTPTESLSARNVTTFMRAELSKFESKFQQQMDFNFGE